MFNSVSKELLFFLLVTKILKTGCSNLSEMKNTVNENIGSCTITPGSCLGIVPFISTQDNCNDLCSNLANCNFTSYKNGKLT